MKELDQVSSGVRTKLTCLWVLVLGAFLILLINREFALADNGDFTRYFGPYVAGPEGFQQNWPKEGTQAFHDRFYNRPQIYWYPSGLMPSDPPWPSSAHVLWTVGRWINDTLSSDRVVNLRLVALPFFVFQFALFALAVLSWRDSVKPFVPWLVSLAIFADVFFTCFYTTFYADGIAILAVMGLASLFLTTLGRYSKLVPTGNVALAMVLCCSAAITAKPQYLYLLLPAIVALALMFGNAILRRSGQGAYSLAVALLVCAGSVGWQQRNQISHMRPMGWPSSQQVNAYHSLYFGLLEHSSNRAGMLSKLGLPADSASMIGTSAFTPAGNLFIKSNPGVTQGVFLNAIFLDPNAFANTILHNANELGVVEPVLFEVPAVDRGHSPIYLSPGRMLFSVVHGLWLVLLAMTAGVLSLLLLRKLDAVNQPNVRALVWFFLLVIPIEIATSTFDGQFDVRKHLIVADLSSCILIGMLLTLTSTVRHAGSRESTKGAQRVTV